MNDDDVRAATQAVCDAVVAGDVDGAIEYLSDELRRNLGEVIALLPLPATEATIESLERGGSAHIAVIRIVGETDEVQLQTRWKDRNGSPRIVELSHLSRVERPEAVEPSEELEPAETPEPGQ